MKWIALTAAVLLSGCAASDSSLGYYRLNENQHFYQAEGSTRIPVKWIRVNDQRLQRICALTTGQPIRPNGVFLGCTGIDPGGTCIIYTSTHTTHQIFGHELRHCFQGNFHP